jgi:ethanolamine utilization microcompartment shell protein EutS
MPEQEDEKQRINRELLELLNELRVALPGVQVLFAFLLILPFQELFSKVSVTDRAVYLGSLFATSLATALLVAPSSWHRLRFRTGDKERMLLVSNRLMIAGMALVAVAMSGVIYLVTDILLRESWAAVIAGANAFVFALLWYVIPLIGRTNGGR